jgi:type II secretory pathway component GspD/PulD (secretin)/tetratricopeptide (TPR) repeat protein
MKFLFATIVPHKSLLVVLTLASVASQSPVLAQSLEVMSNREIVRRQENLLVGEKLISAGDKAAAEKDYETAYTNYLDALNAIPAGAATRELRAKAVSKFSRTALRYAEELIANGRYSDAERVAKTVLLPEYDPSNRAAVRLLSNLEQPDYYNKTVTPQFAADREEVTKLLYEADGSFQAGRFDLAIKRYEQVLNIDRYNIAARKGMERVNLEKAKYYGSAYNETRSRLLWKVDQKWERPVHRFQAGRSTTTEAQARGGIRGTEATMAKLNRIIIPRIDLRDTTVREAVEFLKQRSRELDTSTEVPQEKRGVNIFLKLAPSPDMTAAPPVEGAAPIAPVGGTADTRITLSLTNVPLIEALRYLTELAGLKYKIEPYAVSIVPITEITTELVTKKYRVPPGFIPTSVSPPEVTPSPGAAPIEAPESRIGTRTNALEYLQSQGVSFPSGAFAQYVPASSELIVRNTPDAIDLIDSLVDAAVGVQPTQVEIESKFLEITQNNIKELGFDWLLGPFAIGSTGAYAAGGTQGFGSAPLPANFPFTVGGVPVGTNPLTGGLRSGTIGPTNPTGALSANSIDSLIGALPTGVAPGIFGVSGIFTNPQFQVVIRALNQKKGVDLMSAPKVTTKSGRKAIVRVAREFPYPTEFSPPEPPPPTTGGTGNVVTPPNGTFVSQGVVTPSTPTAFETRNLGVTLEVEPIIGPDGYTIDLNLSPEVVEFDGFINYGSPINGPILNALDPANVFVDTAVVTPNVINQPIFSTRKVTTSVSIWDGQTVALGGLVREDIQKIQDKVPILGDIPLAGRLFRSNVDQKIKRNLIIFVTARLMDAEGRPVRLDEDTEEIVEPLGLPQELPPPAFEIPSYK